MRLGTLLLAAGASAAAIAVNCGAAQASKSDAASTRAYLQANYALLRAARAHVGTAEAELRSILLQVRSECPSVAADSPQNYASEALSHEVIGVMVLSVYHLDLSAARHFLDSVKHLRWSDLRVTRAVRRYAGQLQTLAHLPVPNVCADVRIWVASAYRTLPADTILFDQRFFPAWVSVGDLPSALARFESPEEHNILQRITAIKSELTGREARAVIWWGRITAAIGLN